MHHWPFHAQAIYISPIVGCSALTPTLYESFDLVRINANIEQSPFYLTQNTSIWDGLIGKCTLSVSDPLLKTSRVIPRLWAENFLTTTLCAFNKGSYLSQTEHICWANPLEKKKAVYWFPPLYLHNVSIDLRFSGLRISLSRTVTIWQNLGRSLRSFCQQSSISVWRAAGQPIGAGSL